MTTELNSDPIEQTRSVAAIEPAMPMVAVALQRRLTIFRDAAKALGEIELGDTATYETIVKQGKETNAIAAQLENERVSITKPLLDLKRRWDAMYTPAITLAEETTGILRKLAGGYLDRQRKAREEAERAAAAERARIEREQRAEQERQRREADEAAAAERAAAEAKMCEAVAAQDTEGALASAREIDAAEQRHAAEHARIEEEAAMPLAPVSAPVHVDRAPKMKGMSERAIATWELTSLEDLVRGVVKALDAGDRSLLRFVSENRTEIGKYVRGSGEYARIPGVSVTLETSVAFSRR